jgi:hypothetical protein
MNTPTKNTETRRGMRNPVVNPSEQRKRFLALAAQLRNGTPLSREQIEYLVVSFEQIGYGESADTVFALKRTRGQKIDNEQHRRTMSLVFVQIAHYMAPPDGFPPGEGLPLMEAVRKVVPLARELLGEKDSEQYSEEYLYKLWYDPSYAHMRTTLRAPFDPDSPVPFTPSKA